MSNKQKIILVSIFIVTFVIGLTAIVVLNLLSSPKTTPQQTLTQVPSLTTAQLYCSSTSSNDSLTITWVAPSTLPSTDMIYGEITDTSTQTQGVSFGPVAASPNDYTFSTANGIDTYQATVWIENSKGQKGAIATTNEVNSSLCTSGTQPTPPAALPTVSAAATTTPTPTTATKATATPTATTTTDTPTPTTTTNELACNSFSLEQSGSQLSTDTVAPGSSPVTILPGITSTEGTVSYTSAQWTIRPSTPALNVNSNGSSATWTPPSSTANSPFKISLSGVTDSSGDTLASACTLTITVAGALPDTAGANLADIVILLLGISFAGSGMFLFLKQGKH